MILVVAEARGGTLNRASWEAVACAQQAAAGEPLAILVPGGGDAARLLAEAGAGEVLSVEHEALAAYTPDVQVSVVAQVIAQTSPRLVVMAHTYQARDYAPRLAARLRVPLVADVIGVKGSGTAATFLRPMFQGKLVAEVAPQGAGPAIVSCQIGAFRADAVAKGSPAAVRAVTVTIDAPPATDRGGAIPGGASGGRPGPGRAHRGRGPRHQGAGSDCGRRAAGGGDGSGDCRLASDLRQRLAADGSAGRQLGPDRGAQALRRARDLGRHSAPRRA